MSGLASFYFLFSFRVRFVVVSADLGIQWKRDVCLDTGFGEGAGRGLFGCRFDVSYLCANGDADSQRDAFFLNREGDSCDGSTLSFNASCSFRAIILPTELFPCKAKWIITLCQERGML